MLYPRVALESLGTAGLTSSFTSLVRQLLTNDIRPGRNNNSAMASRELQFIISVPHSAGSSRPTDSQRKIARSHAARSAPAKARRLRTKQYQAQKLLEEHRRLDDANHTFERAQRVPGPEIVNLLSTHRKDPFMSFAKSLTAIEQMLFDHCMCGLPYPATDFAKSHLLLFIDVTAIIALMRCNELPVPFSQRMTRSWIPLAITEASHLNIIFLASCRHLSILYQYQQQQQQQHFFTRLAFQYKLKSLQSLRDAISADMPAFSDSTVAKAIMLAYDEVSYHA